MKGWVRSIACLMTVVLLLSALAGCKPSGVTVDTSEDTSVKETMPQETETQGNDEAPKGEATPKTPLKLHGYRVIIPDQALDSRVESLVAHELKAMLEELGCKVAVEEDRNDPSICTEAVLIGKTAATEEALPTGNAFSVAEKDGQLQISAGNYYAYRAAIDYLRTTIEENGGVPRDLAYTGDTTVANAERATEDSLRVMFYNVYGLTTWKKGALDAQGNDVSQSLTGKYVPPYTIRQDLQLQLIEAYAPDVIGFQEFMSGSGNLDYYTTFLPRMLNQLGYTQVKPEVGRGNCTPLFYNAEKLSVVESGYQLYSVGGNSKSVTWAIFSVKSGKDAGKTFAVFNTHFAYESGEYGDLRREQNAKELVEVINEVTQNGTIAGFMGGDLNFWNLWGNYDGKTGAEAEARISATKPYKVLTEGGMTLLSGLADVESNFWSKSNTKNYTNSYHGFFEYDATKKIYDLENSSLTRTKSTGYTLDYILLRNQSESTVTVKKYYILKDELTCRASDHCPTLADFVLK